nr:putative e3 ubiquitin-protein ligase xerico [Quercus suber]
MLVKSLSVLLGSKQCIWKQILLQTLPPQVYSKIFVLFFWDFGNTEKDMGLSNFPSPAEGVLPVLVMNTVLSVAFMKNMVRSLLQVMGATASDQNPSNLEEEQDGCVQNARERRISITQFKSLCQNRFEAEEEVSELSCKHFFHKGCLEKWFDNKHTTCPICRSMD